ncbi:hypothetical protein H5S09_02390 [Limosilactobacillus sp. STM2_1]|uniref:Glycosyltransferase family 8 protein n=1 Tax=Limosilactobacillus rudii TaxID=2759755 RepID=A0A7W3UKZ7_9LACO|nr:glycosyltransferase [Limosilactobacillus rudii]MBB1080296.1 hypothetical protein [Limosilactobacillus rudii]MBB1096800.1 hypothetical protein [Limosilactobacillus rudii]MCD7133697.1 hypothetical protein [Limosilactobacillus rudii]
MKHKENYTYLTLLNSSNYLKGTLALNYMLKKNDSKYPLTVLTTDNIDNNVIGILDNYNIKHMKIPDVNVEITNNDNLSYWKNTFSKLFVFGMIKFDKIVFLDSDMFVKQNIDELFEKDNLTAVSAGRKFPGNSNWINLNSGIMVIVPKEGEDKRLFNLMNNLIESKKLNNIGDQDVLHIAYPNWCKCPSLHLGEEYNTFASYEGFYLSRKLVKLPIKVIHYVGKAKPWTMSNVDCMKYCIHISLSLIKRTKSVKGVGSFVLDFSKYRKLCMSF